MKQNPYTTWEIRILIKRYRIDGWRIPQLLARHTRRSIITQASKLGICKREKEHKRWTEEEKKILRLKYGAYGSNIPELAHRSQQSIQCKASIFGLKLSSNVKRRGCVAMTGWKYKKSWGDDELLLLKHYYPTHGYKIPALLNTRSARAIKRQAFKMGLRVKREEKTWTN